MGGHEAVHGTVLGTFTFFLLPRGFCFCFEAKVVGCTGWSKSELQLELAIATVDTGEPFVKATCHHERDGPLVFERYEGIATVHASKMHNNHHPSKCYCSTLAAVCW